MPLAFETTPQFWALALLAIVAVGSGAYAYLTRTGHTRAARVTHAVFAGLRTGVKDLELGKDQVQALEDAIRDAAKDWDVSEHVDQHMGDGLTTPVKA